jgi:hypothetical protein
MPGDIAKCTVSASDTRLATTGLQKGVCCTNGCCKKILCSQILHLLLGLFEFAHSLEIFCPPHEPRHGRLVKIDERPHRNGTCLIIRAMQIAV